MEGSMNEHPKPAENAAQRKKGHFWMDTDIYQPMTVMQQSIRPKDNRQVLDKPERLLHKHQKSKPAVPVGSDRAGATAEQGNRCDSGTVPPL
jgi:hypothetical protein